MKHVLLTAVALALAPMSAASESLGDAYARYQAAQAAGDVAEAADAAKVTWQLAQNAALGPMEQMMLAYNAGYYAAMVGEQDVAQTALTQAWEKSSAADDDFRAEIGLAWSQSYAELNDNEALRASREVLSTLDLDGVSSHLRAKLWNECARAAIANNRHNRANVCAQEAHAAYLENPDALDLAESVGLLMNVGVATENQYRRVTRYGDNNLVYLETRQQARADALDYYVQALKLFYDNDMGDHPTAEQLFHRSVYVAGQGGLGDGYRYVRDALGMETSGRPDTCALERVRGDRRGAYPNRAYDHGMDGFAVIEFTLNTEGRVASTEIVAQWPEDYFGEATENTVSRWRYEGTLDDPDCLGPFQTTQYYWLTD